MTAAQTKAHAQGEHVGRLPQTSAALCPYLHVQADLHMAWFDGFSEGRVTLARDEEAAEG